LPDCADAQPTMQDKPITRMMPVVRRTRMDMLYTPCPFYRHNSYRYSGKMEGTSENRSFMVKCAVAE
jgi:hypothetical protein